MKKRLLVTLCLCLCVGFCLSGCTNTKNVTDVDVTLELQYGARSGKYTGTLVDDVPNGSGKFTTKNDAGESWSYEGAFVEGHFSGQGKCVWDSGQIEEGTYSNDMMNGTGKRYANDKPVYDGNWKDGSFDGSGKLYSSDGENYYEGKFVSNIPEEKEFKNKCTHIPYDDLARQPESHIMSPIKTTGKVIQVIENEDGSVNYRVADNGDLQSMYFIAYERKEGEPRILENDMIEMYGLYDGLKTYESIIGGTISVPFIHVKYITINQ